jgi:ketosteroid isomerase-like protein
MKRCVSLLLLLLAAPALAGQTRPVRSVQEILIQLERDWDEAFLRKDVAFIEQVLADDFMASYPDGTRGDKARELAMVAALDQQIESSSLDEFTVTVVGETAVVWFTRRLVGPIQGKRTELTYRFLDVFVWRADRWQCLASHSTKITVP